MATRRRLMAHGKNIKFHRTFRCSAVIGDATVLWLYMNKTKQRNGVSLSDAKNQYLAYHEDKQDLQRELPKKTGLWAWQTKFRAEHRCTSHNDAVQQNLKEDFSNGPSAQWLAPRLCLVVL